LGRKGGKVVALFVDLKAAFDSVDREVLIVALRGRGISEGLVERIEEVLRETKSRVRVGKELGESFWTAKGVRQGCPLSPLLFIILLADLEGEMKKVKWGGSGWEGEGCMTWSMRTIWCCWRRGRRK